LWRAALLRRERCCLAVGCCGICVPIAQREGRCRLVCTLPPACADRGGRCCGRVASCQVVTERVTAPRRSTRSVTSTRHAPSRAARRRWRDAHAS
jgi:hypothetical protein